MERVIKFRGMTLEGQWVYGNISHVIKPVASYKHVEPGYYISNSAGMPFAYAIRPETIGQFTGLFDKNKTKIFEGDRLKSNEDLPLKVGWHKGYASFVITKNDWVHCHFFGEGANPKDCEIIGNIYETTELLTPKP